MTQEKIIMTKNYNVNYETQEIIITRKFGKAASQMGSPEFQIMKKLRTELEGFSIVYKTIEKKENKKSYKGLTIDEMLRYVSGLSNEEAETFEKVIELASHRKGKYAIVKKYFLDNYRESYENEIKSLKSA